MTVTETLIVAAHGSLEDGRAAAPAHAHAGRIRARGGFDAVRVAFWKEEPGLRSVARSVEGAATVVPLLTSEGFFATEVFPTELGLDEDGVADGPLRYANPVGTHPALTDVVAARVAAATDRPERTTVVVVGHGTERNAESGASTRDHARRLREPGTYGGVLAAFLDDEPAVADVLDRVATTEVVVVPLFVADGPHTTEDVPAALGHPGVGRTAHIDGHDVRYTGAVGTEPSLVDVIMERAREAGALVEGDTREHRGTAARLADRFDGGEAPTTWGELRVTASGDGFALCHAEDTDHLTRLSAVQTVAALRTRVRRDETGRYRPLTGAPTLPRGWLLAGLDAADLVRAIETVYPGAVNAWDRDRRDALAPTPLAETVGRQRGMYAALETLDDRDRRAATAAVCRNCVRDRRWPVGDEADPGDGSGLPCESACPYFLAAAHGLAEHGPKAAMAIDPDAQPADFADPGHPVRVRYAEARADRELPVAGGER